MIHVTINGKPVEVSEGSTIMEAAETVGIRIPSLCHMKNVHQYGSCRICVVEVEGMKNLQASCMAKVREGMVIRTHSPKVLAARKVLYELLLSNHPKDCLNCSRNTNCELQELGYEKTQVYTTLELRMKCGIGKCGRCNIGSKYVCKDGPVFRCDEIDELPAEY